MDNTICLDKHYSTTKLLVKHKPQQKHNSSYTLKPKLFWFNKNKYQKSKGLRTKGYFKSSYKNTPLISIVTVVRNGEKHLEQTINSVLNQSYNNIEYIIIDGGSTDNTVEIINKYNNAIDYWISESDSGIYNAMNKGIVLCTGKYIAFLNADDWYAKNAISLVATAIKKDDVDYIFGNVDMYESNICSWTFFPKLEDYKYQMPMPHPGLFVKKKHLLAVGFDESYKTISDYNFVIYIIRKNLKYIYINRTLTNFRIGGLSSSSHKVEHLRLVYLNFGLLVFIKTLLLITKNTILVSLKSHKNKLCM